MTNYERWQLYTRDLESPDIFLRWAWFHLIGSALQRRVWYNSCADGGPDHNSLFTNNFIVLCGPPATGKGRAIKQCSSIIKHEKMMTVRADGRQIYTINYSPDKVTCEKLIQILSHGVKAFDIVNAEGKKITLAHNSFAFLVEELEVLLSTNSQDMVSNMNQLYDSGDFQYSNKKDGDFFIRNVCVNLIAGTTPKSIQRLFEERIIQTGFTSRTIMIFADNPRFWKLPAMQAPEQLQAYLELMEYVKALALTVKGEIKMSPEADEFFRSKYETGVMQHKDRLNPSEYLDDYYGRKKVHWQKLAAILHFSEPCTDNIITLEEVQEAYRTLAAAEVRMHEAFKGAASNELYQNGLRVIRLLGSEGDLNYRKLWFKMSDTLTNKIEVDACINYLLGTGQIVNKNRNTFIEGGVFSRTAMKGLGESVSVSVSVGSNGSNGSNGSENGEHL